MRTFPLLNIDRLDDHVARIYASEFPYWLLIGSASHRPGTSFQAAQRMPARSRPVERRTDGHMRSTSHIRRSVARGGTARWPQIIQDGLPVM